MADKYSCYYNCSEPPESLYPYPDISGVGVLVGYTATAGIVVLILLFHYHLAHDPTQDPFREENESGATISPNPRPNQIDVVYLGIWTKTLAWLKRNPNPWKAKSYPRLETAFVKCVQSMSDLQILTGISILISGYVQLNCGISAFHWQIIVSLAWFSSITHLCCLTFLRNYLYNRPAERLWRLIAMGIMLLMLLVAMVPTGGYNWLNVDKDDYSSPAPRDYAICYFRPSENDDDFSFSAMVISTVLLALGFIYRVVRLHKSLSISFIGRTRTFLSEKARDVLRRTYTRLGMETSALTWKRLFLYRPLLALFLTLRALLDLWNSMFIEVLWMLGSFIWGLIKLLQTVQIDDGGSSDWSFGQVVPIVLLATPLLTIFESFSPAKELANPLSTAPVQIHTNHSQSDHTSSNTPLQARDHPDRDFYHDSGWAHSLIYLMVVYAIGITMVVLVLSSSGSTRLVQLLIPTGDVPSYLPVFAILSICSLAATSMLFEDISCAQEDGSTTFMGMTRKKHIRYCRVFSAYLTLGGLFTSSLYDHIPLSFLGANMAIYCVLSVMTIRHGNKRS